jgi:hypothetical protein
MELTKVCKGCKRELPLTAEYYNRQKTGKDGFRARCKECRKHEEDKETRLERNKKWHSENKERDSENRKKYYQEVQKDTNTEKCREYCQRNRDNVFETARAYRERNKEHLKQWQQKYDEEHREERNALQRKWRINNPERTKEIANKVHHKRKAISRNLPCDFTIKQWAECKERFDNKCAYCGKEKDLAQDHFLPLSKGGEYTKNNIVPTCQSCNSRKSNKNFFEWYPDFRHYSKRREQKILTYLGYNKNNQQLSIL